MPSNANFTEQLNWVLAFMRDVLADRKPRLDPAIPFQKSVYDQMARMSSGLFITDAPDAFITLPTDTKASKREKGIYPIYALGQPTLERGRNKKESLKKEGIFNAKILGIDNTFRRLDVLQSEQQNFAEALVLPPSDFHGLHQFLEIISYRLANKDQAYGPIVLSNTTHFWSGIIEALNLNDKTVAKKLKAANIHIASDGAFTKTLKEMMLEPETPAQKPFTSFNVPEGSTLLVATRNTKKIAELQQIFDAMKINIRVLPFHVVIGRPREAKEESKSYVGNNQEKLEAAALRYETQDPEKLERNLKRYGLTTETTFVLIEDGGFETDFAFFKEPEFAEVMKHLNSYKNGPGVETANLLKALTTREIFSRINQIVERKKAEGEAAPDMKLSDFSCTLLVPLNEMKSAGEVAVSTFGVTRDRITTEPRPDEKVIYTDHHMIPLADPQGRTRAEIDDFITHKSMRADAVRALMYMTGLKEKSGMRRSFDDVAKPEGGFKIGTQSSLHSEIYGHGIKGWKHGLKGDFQLVSGQCGSFELSWQHSITLNKNGVTEPAYSTFSAFQNFVTEADAFALGPMPDKMNTADYKMKNLFMFTSLVVGKQVFDPHIQPKPIVIDRDAWKDELEVYDYSHDLTLIGDKPEHLFVTAGQDEFKTQSIKILKREMKDYVRLPDENELFVEEHGDRSEGLFRVSIYSSASTKNDKLLQEAEELAYRLAAQGYAVKNGGGAEGMMVETSKGVHRYREEMLSGSDNKRARNWVGSIQCIDTVESEGLYAGNDFVSIQPNIHLRMEDLQDVEAEIFMAGGAGTIQEMAATIIDRMRNGRTENRPMILLNQKIDCGGKKLGVWDQMLEYIPEDLHAKCNIKVVDSIEKAMDIVNEARAARGMEISYEKIIRPANQNELSGRLPEQPQYAIS